MEDLTKKPKPKRNIKIPKIRIYISILVIVLTMMFPYQIGSFISYWKHQFIKGIERVY